MCLGRNVLKKVVTQNVTKSLTKYANTQGYLLNVSIKITWELMAECKITVLILWRISERLMQTGIKSDICKNCNVRNNTSKWLYLNVHRSMIFLSKRIKFWFRWVTTTKRMRNLRFHHQRQVMSICRGVDLANQNRRPFPMAWKEKWNVTVNESVISFINSALSLSPIIMLFNSGFIEKEINTPFVSSLKTESVIIFFLKV